MCLCVGDEMKDKIHDQLGLAKGQKWAAQGQSGTTTIQ